MPSRSGRHPVLLGHFPALVFSGDRKRLGELPGEMTASTLHKYALADLRLSGPDDFARTPHMPLPLWPADQVKPVQGVCFVVSDSDHPVIASLTSKGGIENEHFVVADSLLQQTEDHTRFAPLYDMIASIADHGCIVLLGYGDQGSRLAAGLQACGLMDVSRLVVIDENDDSRQRAMRDGIRVLDGIHDETCVVVYTPLMRYDRLHRFLLEARARGIPTFDNSNGAVGNEHFRLRGCIMLDAAADRALEAIKTKLHLRNHGLPIKGASVVREEDRLLAGRSIAQLTSGHRIAFDSKRDAVDLTFPSDLDQLAVATFGGLRRAFVSLRNRPDTAVFAARVLCCELWPDATSCIFPARCAEDLGSTAFERLLKRHCDGAEIIAASQSSAQQAVLGIAARHYAQDSPIIEIGSALGGSGILMVTATAPSNAPFLSIDPETATRHIMRWGFEQQHQLQRLHQIVQTSDNAIAELHEMHCKAGLVFIDGLHSEAAMTADFSNYAPLVRLGGALLIHDVEAARYSVLRVVVEHVLNDPRFEPRCLVDGLLVLERVM